MSERKARLGALTVLFGIVTLGSLALANYLSAQLVLVGVGTAVGIDVWRTMQSV